MWNLKCKVVPVITGDTGVAAKGLKTNLDAIPGKYLIDSLEKTTILTTSYII
jgi:hypothetical protein